MAHTSEMHLKGVDFIHQDTRNIHRACSFTGHRPARFNFGYDENDERCLKIKQLMAEHIGSLIACGVNTFYSGMALGADQWASEIVLEMKTTHPEIRLIAVRPCETQADRWSDEQRKRHYDTLAQCDEVVTIQPNFTRAGIFKRNRYLVDHAENLLAVYDGGAKGGTAYTVKYGVKQGRKITIIHPDTQTIKSEAI